MKKPILLILVSIILLLNFTIPAFADDKDDKYEMVEIMQYNIAIVEKGTITVDGVFDEAYLGSTKITHYDDEEYYKSSKFEDKYLDIVDARFFAYVVVDTEGMYIYAEIEDKTMYVESDTSDKLEICLDFFPYAYMHPQVGNYVYKNLAAWDDTSPFIREEYFGNIRRYRGDVWIDYNDVAKGFYGFNLAQPQMDFFQHKAAKRTDETGWIAELFIPWLMDEQGEAIAKGEQFHCSIGFMAVDDPIGDSKSYVTRHESPIEIGEHHFNPALLSDLIWGERPDPTPETSDTAIAVISALIISGAGVVIFSRKKRS